MRVSFFVFLALLCGQSFAQDHRLSPRFRTTYIAPMSSGLDQHLASRLTSAHVLWIVLEPGSADAVLTDSVDESFWAWLARTYPAAQGASAGVRGSGYQGDNPALGNPSGGKNRGTVFLVDPRRRVVLWSCYELPKNSSSVELDRSAARITNQLRTAFTGK